MKYAHIADCHLGGWRQQKLKEANHRAFTSVIDTCLRERVDFVLIAGDFFNTSFPSIDALHFSVLELMRLKEAQIPVYIIPGSHDFSPSGRTMLDVLERAGLFINVMHHATVTEAGIKLNLVTDPKTGAQITGMYGRRGGLDKHLYKYINRAELEQTPGYKIFMFHCTVTECKPKDLAHADSVPISLFPANFSYYAGGHVHVRSVHAVQKYKNVVYPGPVFPNSFSELEKLGAGSFVMVEDGVPTHRRIETHPIVSVLCDITGFTPEQASQHIRSQLQQNLTNAIVLLRIQGTLKSGRIMDLGLPSLIDSAYVAGAYVVLKNTAGVLVQEQKKYVKRGSTQEIETRLIDEYVGKQQWISRERETQLIGELMQRLSVERDEGEKIYDYESRIQALTKRLFN